MTVLRQAVQKFLWAYDALADTPAPMSSSEMLEAITGLEQALAYTEPISTDELLSRLQPGQWLRVNVLSAQSPRPICIATVGYEPFSAPVRGAPVLAKDGCPVSEIANHPAAALRAALLQLPEPTQPPPRKGA